MTLSDEAKKLRIIYDESKAAGLCKNSIEFSKLIKIDQAEFSRMVNGKYPVTYKVVKNVCHILGYSPAWIILNEGKRKISKEDVKLVTEISMLRTENEIMAARLLRLEMIAGITYKPKYASTETRSKTAEK